MDWAEDDESNVLRSLHDVSAVDDEEVRGKVHKDCHQFCPEYNNYAAINCVYSRKYSGNA